MTPREARLYVESYGFEFDRFTRHGYTFRHPCGAVTTVSDHSDLKGTAMSNFKTSIKRALRKHGIRVV